MIEYRIFPLQPTAHMFEVVCRIAEPDPAGQRVTLPAWIPGSYLVRDFARHIVSISASDTQGAVQILKTDKQSWQCVPAQGALEIRCEIYAFDESVRAAYLNESRGFFNGTSVFLRVVGQEGRACRVHIQPPTEARYADWRLATTLPVVEIGTSGFGTYEAPSYDALIDYPVEMGVFERVDFVAGGVPHAMVLCGEQSADTARLAADLGKICAQQQAMFEGSPLQRYLFLTLVKTQGYGGLEHRDSTALICNRDDMPLPGMGKATPGYHRFLGLCSHEYFHLWNVKRIRPPAVAASDLAAEAHFRDLWAYEGITSYYDELFLLRAGVIEPLAWLDELAKTLTRVWRTPGRQKQSLTESSFDAWTKFYKQDENSANAIVSYYAKGAVVAMCLDLHLRINTDKSLDDVMRLLWQRYGSVDMPVPEHGIEALVEEVAGKSYVDFFAAYVHGLEDPPVAELLAAFGVQATLRPRQMLADMGGQTSAPNASDADLGMITAQEQGREIVKVVLNYRPAEQAGLQAEDELLAIDGQRLAPGGLDRFLEQARAGQVCRLHIFRDHRLIEKQLTIGSKPQDTWSLQLSKGSDAGADALRQSWWRSHVQG